MSGNIADSYTPGWSYLQSPYPPPRIPLPNRSSLFSADGLTFQSPPPQQPQQPQPQQPQQQQPVPSDIDDVSTFEYIAIGLAGGIWIGANFVCQSIGSMLGYAASSLRSTISAAITKNPKPTRRRNRDHRHDPLGERVRLKSPKPLKSAMAPKWRKSLVAPDTPANGDGVSAGQGLLGVLPYHAGATSYHAHPNAGGVEVDGDAELARALYQNSQDAAVDADGDIKMSGVTSPISELPLPQIQEPKAKPCKRVRFEYLPKGEGKEDAVSSPVSPVRNPPIGIEDPFDFREDFRKNFNKAKYTRWIEFLQSQGISVKEYRETLHNDLTLPTDVIMRLYSQRHKNPENWRTLITCLSHDGFLDRMGILVPKYKYGPPPINWEKDEHPLQILYDSPYQQRDGRCSFCRGFKWAGVVESRRIERYGDEVECRSQHRSAIPYTKGELEDFRKGVFDSFWRRCCQESRWDWVFDEPVPKQPGKPEWQIPQWDVRLRHYRRFKNPLTGGAHGHGLFLPHESDLLELQELQKKLSRQDLAAKLFIDAIKEAGNKELASDLRKMDKERKRKQVQTEFLCVRQVRLVVGESPTKVNNHNDMVKQFAEEKPEEDFDFLGLETWATESDCDPGEPAVPNSTRITEREEARRAAAEWTRFEIFKKQHEQTHRQKAETHYALAGLDPEEFAARQSEYDQDLWKEFLMKDTYWQEKERDEQSRLKKQRPPVPPMKMSKSGWGRKIAEKHGIPPIMGERATLEERRKQAAVIRRHAKECKRMEDLQRAREEQRSKLTPIFS